MIWLILILWFVATVLSMGITWLICMKYKNFEHPLELCIVLGAVILALLLVAFGVDI